jgi:hypothetical protein
VRAWLDRHMHFTFHFTPAQAGIHGPFSQAIPPVKRLLDPSLRWDDGCERLCCKIEWRDSLSEFCRIDGPDGQTDTPKISHDELERI